MHLSGIRWLFDNTSLIPLHLRPLPSSPPLPLLKLPPLLRIIKILHTLPLISIVHDPDIPVLCPVLTGIVSQNILLYFFAVILSTQDTDDRQF